jgi:RNA polymerase sigma-70 factor (ECF subfamily)
MNAERRRQIQGWMAQFADGDRAAFQPLFDALWPVLLAFASRTLEQAPDAEDAAQQAMLKIFSRIVDFDRTRDGVSWALGIAGYEVMTLRKQRTRRREAGAAALDGLAQAGSDPEAQAVAEQLRQAVFELVGELPESDRAALACAFTGASPPADERSRKRRFRAVERLRAAWRRAHG